MNQTIATFDCQWTQDGKEVGKTTRRPLHRASARSLKPPGQARGKLTLKITLPIAGIAGLWHPYVERGTLQKVEWSGRLVGSPFCYPGLVAFVDGRLRNRLLLLTEPIDREVVLTWALDQAGACYRIEIQFGKRSAGQVRVRYSAEPRFVHDLAARILDDRAPLIGGPVPSHLFEPSFCTWYAYHGALEANTIERCARLARQLGIGTLILDEGWQYDAPQRRTTTATAWFRFYGDYVPSRRKFGDFGAHVRRVQAMGLRYLLWIGPMLIGVKTTAFQRFRKRLLSSYADDSGLRVVDPRDEVVTEYVASALERLVREYPIDGFKEDYDYALLAKGQVPYWVGSEYGDFIRMLIRRVRAIKPDLEWNLIPNAFARTVTNAFRCVDVPFDPDSNRMYMANLRVLAGRAALYSDPMIWSSQDSVTAVHRHVVPSLFCVPSVGAPLLDLPRSHLDALRNWLGFYRRHQPVLNHGEFRPNWTAGDFQSFVSTRGNQRIAAAFSTYPVAIGEGETLLINATDERFLRVELGSSAEAVIEDAAGQRLVGRKRLPAGAQRVDCPPGGVAKLRMD